MTFLKNQFKYYIQALRHACVENLTRASHCSSNLRNQHHINLTMKRLVQFFGFWQGSPGGKFQGFVTALFTSPLHFNTHVADYSNGGWWNSSLRLRMSCWGKDKNHRWGGRRRRMKIKSITLRGAHYETVPAPAKSNFLSLSTSIHAGIRADMLLSLTQRYRFLNTLKCTGRTLVSMCNKQKRKLPNAKKQRIMQHEHSDHCCRADRTLQANARLHIHTEI